MMGIDPSHRKSSGERLSVKYTKDMGQGKKSRRLDSSRLESSRLFLVKVDSTYTEHSVLRFKESYRVAKFRTKLGLKLQYCISVLPLMSQTGANWYRAVKNNFYFKKGIVSLHSFVETIIHLVSSIMPDFAQYLLSAHSALRFI